MSLVLSSTPQNNTSSSSSTPFFQDWAPVSGVNYFWSNVAVATLIPALINFKIKDVIGNPIFSSAPEGYTEFRLVAYQQYGAGNPIDWITPGSISAGGYPINFGSPIALTDNGTNFNFTPVLQNLALLDLGTYTFTSYIVIEGLNSFGSWSQVSSYQHTITITVANTLIQYSPSSLLYQHTQGGTLPSRTVYVTGSSWVLKAPPHFTLSLFSPGPIVISTITPEEGEPYQIATGIGTAPIIVTLGDYYDGDYDEADLNPEIQLYVGETLAGIIPILVQVESANIFQASPQVLSFTAVKDIVEPTPQYIYFFCSDPPFTITCSPWLTAVLDTIDINGILTEVIKVLPIPTANMEIGQYTGFVKLTDTIDSEDYEINIDVNYDLNGFVQSPYPPGEKAFTLDPEFFSFTTALSDTYFQLQAKVRVFDFFGTTFKDHIITEKLPPFEGYAELNYGTMIHKLMDRFTEYNENEFQYKRAEFTLFVEEFSMVTNTVIRSALLPVIHFVAGLSRVMRIDKALLEFNEKPVRATTSGFYLLNILVPNFSYVLNIYRNDTIVQTIRLPYPDNRILCKKITFEDFVQGDIIRVQLAPFSGELEENLPEKKFYMIPEGTYSRHITWENEYLVQSALECHGALTVKPDFEYKSNTIYQNLVEILEYIETKKTGKLSVSTGWILSSQVDEIERLMRTRKAWIEIGDKRVAIRPINKSFVAVDTERELVEYILEFQINPSYDQETYSL